MHDAVVTHPIQSLLQLSYCVMILCDLGNSFTKHRTRSNFQRVSVYFQKQCISLQQKGFKRELLV